MSCDGTEAVSTSNLRAVAGALRSSLTERIEGGGGVVLASGSNGGTATLSDDFSNYDVIKVASTSGIHSSFVELVAPLETNTNYMMFSTGGGMAYVRFTGKRTMTGVSGSYFVIGYKYQTA